MGDMTVKRLLLVGNGINLVARSHSRVSYIELLRKAAALKGIKISSQDDIDVIHRKLADYAENHSNDDSYAEIYPELAALRPTYAHHLLAALRCYFTRILTLNFDAAMERALGLKAPRGESPLHNIPTLKKSKVCHIHGSVNRVAPKESKCIIAPSSYRSALTLFPENLPESLVLDQDNVFNMPWFYAFMTHEVHICGAALHDNELLLWRVFQLRQQWINQQVGNAVWNNRIYVYLFQRPSEKDAIKRLADKLRSLSVVPIIIPVRRGMRSDSGFNAAWECLVGKLFIHLQNVHMYYDSLQELPLGKAPYARSVNRNVSISQSVDLKYPDQCVMFVPYKKLKSDKLCGKSWLFYCGIEKRTYFWRLPVDKLQTLADAQFQDKEKERFALYLNYKTGELSHLTTLQHCASCTKCTPSVFDKSIINLSKS